jgi:prophage regulatory protein
MSTSEPPSASGKLRVIRREELRLIVPLADTTIYEMEQRGEFPKRFYLTSRCAVWDLAEVEAWLKARRADSDTRTRAPFPAVSLRKSRPLKKPRHQSP